MDTTGMMTLVSVDGVVATYRLVQPLSARMAMLMAVSLVTDTHREVVVVDATGQYIAGARG